MSTAYIVPTAHRHSPTVNVADREDARRQLMDRGAPEYTQPGLHSPYNLALRDSQSEDSPPADQASAAQFTNAPQPDVRPANFASSSTPTSDYSVNASSARSANFPPDYLARQQQYAHHQNNSSAGAGNMAQATSPSMSLQDGHQHNHHNAPHMKSDPDVPIDPSIAASSPTFPGHYSPYPPPGNDMAQYQGHPPPQMYGRPDWAPQYAQHAHGMPGPYSSPGTAVSSASSVATAGPRPGHGQSHPLSQVYSFVPIPGAQQHKRPRRRYEEIERMYKCGWHGCEKAYGTLNHLNAHVTMQSHGAKRTPEEFKEIRKEWKARKKEEENQRKADEERQRATAQANPVDGQAPDPAQAPSAQNYPPGVRQLPPIGYGPAGAQAPGQYPGGVDPMYQQGNGQMYQQYPHSPYGQGQQMYQQRHTPMLDSPEVDADAAIDPENPSNYTT